MSELGHHPNRAYISQDGNFYLNDASFYNSAGSDIATALTDLDNLSTAELGFLDGITAGASTASKAVVLDSSSKFQGWKKVVEAHTTDDTLTVAESGSIHTTVGAAGTVVFTLPAAVTGLEYFFKVGAAQELRIDPDGSETIALPSTGVQGAAGKYLTANAAGETVHIISDADGTWSVYGFTGTWTAEA